MKIVPIPALQDNYIWLIVTDNLAFCVDPGDAAPVLAYLNVHQLQLAGILITHHHWDHTQGIADLLAHKAVPVYGATNSGCEYVDHPIPSGDTLTLTDDLHYQVLAIPGHTLDHTAYIHADHVFTGDTLFASGCGKVFEGTPAQMLASLKSLATLPPNTAVYCGHEYTLANLQFALQVEPENEQIKQRIKNVRAQLQEKSCSLPSTLQDELNTNPFLRCHIPNVITRATEYAGKTYPTEVNVFHALRTWKNTL